MSLMTYNNIPLPYPLTTSFRQRAVRDESDTDRVYLQVDLTVQCLINASYLTMLAPALIQNGVRTTNTAADIMKAVRGELLKDRKRLTFTFNGENLLPGPQGEDAAPLQGTVDALNGPKPQYCEVTQMTNASFLMTYRVIAHYWENNLVSPGETPPNANRAGNDVLYNRWTETVDIDQSLYSTRTREGTFCVRTDNTSGAIADQIRGKMAQLAVPTGFVRRSRQFQQSADGTKVRYRVVDQEVYMTPPYGAFEADGEFIENSSQNMAYHTAECWVRLRGSKATRYETLLLTAMAVVNAKLRMKFAKYLIRTDEKPAGEAVAATLSFCTNMQVRVKLYDKEVTVRASGLIFPPKQRGKVTSLNFAGFYPEGMVATPTTPFDPTGLKPPPSPLRATAPFILRAAAYWDASLVAGAMTPDGVNMAQGVTPGQAGLNPEA